MNLDAAFKRAIKKFYDGAEYGSVDKYSKRPFDYGFKNLDEIHKKIKKGAKPVEDEKKVEEEVVEDEEGMEEEAPELGGGFASMMDVEEEDE